MGQTRVEIPSSAARVIVPPLDVGQVIIVVNPDSNSNPVYMQTNGEAATTTDTFAEEVNPGGFGVAILEPGEFLSMIAATAATRVILKKFRARATLAVQVYALAAAVALMISNLFWVGKTATVMAMRGTYTTWRANSGADAVIQNDQANAGLTIANGANGNATLLADGTGTARIAGDGGPMDFAVNSGSGAMVRTGATILLSQAGTEWSFRNNSPIVYYNGNLTSARHLFNATDRYMYMVGDGASNTVFDCTEMPIVDSNTIAAGDGVIYAFGGNRANKITLAGAQQGVGIAIVGGTGNAGGTVKAMVRTKGILVGTLVADNAGVTQGQFLIGGATDVNQYASQATIEGSFGRVLETAASGAAFAVALNGLR